MIRIDEDFTCGLSPHWKPYLVGQAKLECTGHSLRLAVDHALSHAYSDAQIDDYQGLARRRFPWRPPLRLTVRARFSHPSADQRSPEGEALLGTAGFGFWNDPFLMTGFRWPTLPRAVWFFYCAPPSNLKLAVEAPGHGWKAATIDALSPWAVPLALLAPILVPLLRTPLYPALWATLQRRLKIRERLLDVEMTDPHTYCIEWGVRQTHFYVDGRPVLTDAPSPRGPLGFVMWVDNQYMVATPWGCIRWGLQEVPFRQSMEVERLTIERLDAPSHK